MLYNNVQNLVRQLVYQLSESNNQNGDRILLEDGFSLLLEDGGFILLE